MAGEGGDGAQGQGTYILLKPELLGNVADLLQRRFWALQEHVLQVASHSVLNTRSLSLSGLHKGLCFAYLGGWRTDDKGRAGRTSFRPDEQQHHGVGGSSKLLSRYQLDGMKKKNLGRVVWTRGSGPSPSRTEELHSIPLRTTPPRSAGSLSRSLCTPCTLTSCRFSLLSASSTHFCSRGRSLHMFLKLSCRASKRQMVVWLNTFPGKAS